MSVIDLQLPGKRTSLYPITSKLIKDDWIKLEREQITPWCFLTSGKEFRVHDFYGKQIFYQGVAFNGSPRDVFWGRYIESFLEDISIRAVNETIKLCLDKDQEPEPALRETADLLKLLIKTTYDKMINVDQILSGKGHPENVAKRKAQKEISAMEDFVETRIKSELDMWKRPSKFHNFRGKYPFITSMTPTIIFILLTVTLFIYNQCQSSSVDKSFRRSVQKELQKARDDLDLTLAYRDQNTRRLVVFDLVYKDQIPNRFSGNQALSADVQSLYDSLNSAKKSAESLFDLLAKKDADKEAISSHESAIRRAIKSADEIGPRIEQSTGIKWKIPPGNLSPQEKVKHFESLLITSAATDSQVEVKSISPMFK